MRIEKVMDVTIQREIARLERRLLFLATVGSAGLRRPVQHRWGIMTSFRAIAGQQSNLTAVVAPGIANSVRNCNRPRRAIPATIFYNVRV